MKTDSRKPAGHPPTNGSVNRMARVGLVVLEGLFVSEVVGRIVGFLVVLDEGMSVIVVGAAVGLIVLVMLLGAPLDGLEETGALVVLGTMDGMGAAVGDKAVLRDGLAVVGKVVGPLLVGLAVLAVGPVVVGTDVGGTALNGLGAGDEVVGAFVVGTFDGLYVNCSSEPESGSIYTAETSSR